MLAEPQNTQWNIMNESIKDGLVIRKWPEEHCQELHTKTQMFSYGQSIFVCHIQPKHFFDLCIHWVSVVRVLKERVAEDDTSDPHDFKL